MKSDELKDLGTKYSEAWSSQKPESVAEFFSENRLLQINDDLPAPVGLL